MKNGVEIITVGDEILMGQVVNTNAAQIGERLTAAGIPVEWMTVVRDQRQPLLDAFASAAMRTKAIIITGGLGPTPDDVTKPCLVEFFSDKLVLREDLLKKVERRFTGRGLKLPEASRGQAEFPSSANEIPNPNGTATGIHYSRGGREWFALPGVPYEMQAMVEEYILPRLLEIGLGGKVAIRILRTSGIGESFLLERMTRFDEAASQVDIAFLSHYFGVDVKLTARGTEPSEIKKRLEHVEKLLLPDIEKFLYGYDAETLPEALGRLLKEKDLRLSIAESCTGGLIAKLMTDIPGASDYFDRGVVSYSNQAKTELLGVPASMIEDCGAVSAAVAEAMAHGILERSNADITASVTGIAGPMGGTLEKPVGLVYIAIADQSACQVHELRLIGDRDTIRKRATTAALKLLYDRVKNLDSEE